MSNQLQLTNVSYYIVYCLEFFGGEGAVILLQLFKIVGHTVAQLVEALHYKFGRLRVQFPVVSLEFFFDRILPATLWPWG